MSGDLVAWLREEIAADETEVRHQVSVIQSALTAAAAAALRAPSSDRPDFDPWTGDQS